MFSTAEPKFLLKWLNCVKYKVRYMVHTQPHLISTREPQHANYIHTMGNAWSSFFSLRTNVIRPLQSPLIPYSNPISPRHRLTTDRPRTQPALRRRCHQWRWCCSPSVQRTSGPRWAPCRWVRLERSEWNLHQLRLRCGIQLVNAPSR